MQNTTDVASTSQSVMTENLEQAKQLVSCLEDGDAEQADIIINDLCLSRESMMFQGLGKLTREIHETINDIGRDTRLNDIMNNEISDAKNNLSHVISLTEDAANQTLTAIEHSTPLLTGLSERAIDLQGVLQEHVKKITADSKLSFVAAELEGFLDKVNDDVKNINKNMNVILMAQGYQDLTGQIIQRVSKMVQDVELGLVDILKLNSSYKYNNKKKEVIKDNAGYGPAVPGIDKGEVMENQDDVDDLLSTLGF